jgi:outer membrane protein
LDLIFVFYFWVVVAMRAGAVTCGMFLALALFGWSGYVSAETLNSALSAAYGSNPTLLAERAKLRATDEGVAQAKSGFRPRVSGSAYTSHSYTSTDPDAASGGRTHPGGWGATITQPVFTGLQTLNSVRSAEDTVRAGRERLREVEQQVLLSAVTAYVDVVQNSAIVRLRRNNVKVLAEQLRASRDRFEVGEVTKTDVAQAEARHAGALSSLNAATGNLRTSRATYEKVIGHAANHPRHPPFPGHLLPRTLQSAVKAALFGHPSLRAAMFNEKSSRHSIDRITGEFLPQVSVEASYQHSYNPSRSLEEQEVTSIKGTLSVPLYQAGEVSARLRQARQTNRQYKQQIDEARAQVNADVVAAWHNLNAVRARIESDRAQVNAASIALTGVREEEKVGQRTVLDVLDAEQELLDAKVNQAISKRDLVVASYNLLAAVGKLNSSMLGLAVDTYDPNRHYLDVRRRWFGMGSDDGPAYRPGEYDHEHEVERRLLLDRGGWNARSSK